jgi:hypothetical protein
LSSTWGTETVTIIVGAEKKKFVLHKRLVCRKAPYFDKMFNGNFEEAKTQDCCLQEEEAFTFEVFVFYIYTGRFPEDVKAVSGIASVYEPIIKFYVLADKLLMSMAAKTAALDALVKTRASSCLRMDETMIKFVLNQTADDCPLRKLTVDMMCRDFLNNQGCGRDWLDSCLKDASFEQIAELLMAIKSVAGVRLHLSEEICKKLVNERRSITSVPEYQIGYLKVVQQGTQKAVASLPNRGGRPSSRLPRGNE